MRQETLLLRQVHPSFVQGDTISSQVFTSQVFRPTIKDNGYLSVYSEEHFSSQSAFFHYTDHLGHDSVGIVAVNKEECDQESLPVIEDNDPFIGHCSIDYNGLPSNRQVDKKAKKLKAKAEARGWLFRNT